MENYCPTINRKSLWKSLAVLVIVFFSYSPVVGQTTVVGFCYDNGTPSDTTDDVIAFTYDPSSDSGCGLSAGFYGGIVTGNDSTTIDSTYEAFYLFPGETTFNMASSAPGGNVTYRIRRSVGATGTVGSGDKWIYLTNGTVECWLEIVDPLNPCSPPCIITALSGLPSSCNPSDSSFSISGDFVYTNTPLDSVLVRYGNRKDILVLTGSPMSYTINNLDSDGIIRDLIVSYIPDNACSDTIQIQAPAPCSTPVDVNLTVEKNTGCEISVDDLVNFTVRVFRTDGTSGDVDLVVKDSLEMGFEFISYTTSQGSFDSLTGIWSGISISQIDTAILNITARVLTNRGGFVCNNAWVLSQSKDDIDSVPGNKDLAEDDSGKSCVSIPTSICSAANESVLLTAPSGLTSYQWRRNGVDIPSANSDTYLATQGGTYTVVLSDPSACNSFDCCPIVVSDICECYTGICTPFIITKN